MERKGVLLLELITQEKIFPQAANWNVKNVISIYRLNLAT